MIGVLCGCGGPPPAKAPPPADPGVERTMHSGAGEATYRGDGGQRGREWTVTWDSATLDVGGDGSIGGSMEGVRGVLYRGDEPVSDFTAEAADADRSTGVLKLSGAVRVVSRKDQARLECQSLEWRGSENVVAAKGRVRVETADWVAGPADELWTNADLTMVGTPDRFGEK